MAKKFILIDQSIASIAGHHYEYAVHVLEAAKRAGYEPCLATHLRFSKAAQKTPWRTFPFYRFSFWAAQENAQIGLVSWLLGRLGWMRFRWRMLYRFSLFGLLWSVRDRFSDFLLKQPLDRSHAISLLTLVPAALLLKLLRFAGLLLLLPVMLLVFLWRSSVRLLKAGGFPQEYVKSLFADIADLWNFLTQIFSRRHSYQQWWQQYRALKSFRKDTERVLRDTAAGPGDIVFVPTLSAIELMGLAAMLQDRTPGPSWHLLFRRDIYRGRESDYASQEWRVAGLRNSLRVSMSKVKGHDVRFYTDTEELTRQYNRLGAIQFETAPIPHTHPRAEHGPQKRTLRLIYMGDARREKGFHWIPRLVNDLWEDYVQSRRISFHLQSNFNIPTGEPEAVIAKEQLRQLALRQPGAIELIDQPMTSEQYKAFLMSGDINLLMYDAENYYARSSGILVESLSAGIPVVVPAGCWLSKQFQGAVHQYWRELSASEEHFLKTHHLRDLRWQVHGNSRAVAVVNGELRIGAGKVFTWLRPQAEATHLLLDLHANGSPECSLAVDQLDARGNSLGVHTQLLENGPDGGAMALLRLQPKAAKLWIGFSGASSISNLLIHSLKGDMPSSVVGTAYRNASDVSGLIREMIDRYEHYSASARSFAAGWADHHNADRLVAALANPLERNTP